MSFALCEDQCRSVVLGNDSPTGRLIAASEIRFSEIISALSVALDITQGQPEGHSMRSALIGMRLAEELHLATADRSALFYALLLKDLGCSSNAAKMAYLFGADDRLVKRSARMTDLTLPDVALKHCWRHCAPGGSVVDKLLKMAAIVRTGAEGARKICQVRCERGAEIATALQLPEATATAILHLDEHWDGQGCPRGLKGDEISLLGRICCLAQTVEVFFSTFGLTSALEVASSRRGRWFDPSLVDALHSFQRDTLFWARLGSDDLPSVLAPWEPEDNVLLADEPCLDRVAEAFARVVDAKSPWTYLHSTRVAEIAVGISRQFGISDELERDLRRSALLHDIGKLGISSLILEKPGKPTAEEFDEIRKHPDYTQRILQRVHAFGTLADVASAHHERLDGRGYHRRIDGTDLPWVARVLAVADVCEALSAKRPYRDALPWASIEEIVTRDSGTGLDPECVAALKRWHDRQELESRVDAQLNAVDRLMAEL
jgi:HD-GYP domain-containing protein (c-di-GMP phosphodiesterase class II)